MFDDANPPRTKRVSPRGLDTAHLRHAGITRFLRNKFDDANKPPNQTNGQKIGLAHVRLDEHARTSRPEEHSGPVRDVRA